MQLAIILLCSIKTYQFLPAFVLLFAASSHCALLPSICNTEYSPARIYVQKLRKARGDNKWNTKTKKSKDVHGTKHNVDRPHFLKKKQ